MTWTLLRRRNSKKETESLLIVAQNDYMKGKIDNTREISKFRLFGDRNETVNLILSEHRKLSQKEHKKRYDCVR